MLTWQRSEKNGERNTSWNEVTKSFLLKVFIIGIYFITFEIAAEDVNICGENLFQN